MMEVDSTTDSSSALPALSPGINCRSEEEEEEQDDDPVVEEFDLYLSQECALFHEDLCLMQFPLVSNLQASRLTASAVASSGSTITGSAASAASAGESGSLSSSSSPMRRGHSLIDRDSGIEMLITDLNEQPASSEGHSSSSSAVFSGGITDSGFRNTLNAAELMTAHMSVDIGRHPRTKDHLAEGSSVGMGGHRSLHSSTGDLSIVYDATTREIRAFRPSRGLFSSSHNGDLSSLDSPMDGSGGLSSSSMRSQNRMKSERIALQSTRVGSATALESGRVFALGSLSLQKDRKLLTLSGVSHVWQMRPSFERETDSFLHRCLEAEKKAARSGRRRRRAPGTSSGVNSEDESSSNSELSDDEDGQMERKSDIALFDQWISQSESRIPLKLCDVPKSLVHSGVGEIRDHQRDYEQILKQLTGFLKFPNPEIESDKQWLNAISQTMGAVNAKNMVLKRRQNRETLIELFGQVEVLGGEEQGKSKDDDRGHRHSGRKSQSSSDVMMMMVDEHKDLKADKYVSELQDWLLKSLVRCQMVSDKELIRLIEFHSMEDGQVSDQRRKESIDQNELDKRVFRFLKQTCLFINEADEEEEGGTTKMRKKKKKKKKKRRKWFLIKSDELFKGEENVRLRSQSRILRDFVIHCCMKYRSTKMMMVDSETKKKKPKRNHEQYHPVVTIEYIFEKLRRNKGVSHAVIPVLQSILSYLHRFTHLQCDFVLDPEDYQSIKERLVQHSLL